MNDRDCLRYDENCVDDVMDDDDDGDVNGI